MKILGTLEIKPGMQITNTWDTVTHEGAEYAIFSRTDDGQTVLLPLDSAKISKLDAVFGLAVKHVYNSLLKLTDAKLAKLS